MNEPIPTDAIDRRINERAAGVFDNVPAWISTIALVVGGIGGGGMLYSRVEATEALAYENKARITAQELKQSALDKDISTRLTRIETNLEYIKERLP